MSRDRDRILEQALKHELKGVGTPPAGACLDAETLGAWTDGGLDPAAMAACEAHVATCARCQALVGTLARGTAGTLGTVGTQGTAGTQGTLSLWKWWLAPIAAGVTAVTLWMVVPEQAQRATEPPLLSRVAEEGRARVAEDKAPAAPLEEKAKAAPVDQLAGQYAPERDTNTLAAGARDDRSQYQQKAQERKEEAPLRQVRENAALADAAAPAAAPSPAAPPPPAAAVALEAPQVGALQKSARAAAIIEIATLDPSVGWRIAGDRIEHSVDGGKTWIVSRQNSSDGLTAGSAPSNEVCWFVGRAGRVLRTTNGGATFTDVSLAEPIDLSSVAALDAANAMVYSTEGRRFRTTDGGRTWRLF